MRCDVHGDQPNLNAEFYDQYGQRTRRAFFGDGIESVQVDRNGEIWVSFFDEGVFGDDLIGHPGLIRFNAQGELVWSFTPPEGYDYICDCYALNIADDGAWAYYYTPFSVVHVDWDGDATGYNNEFAGAKAIVVHPQRIMLYGGYSGERSRCVVQNFADHLYGKREIRLTLPDGKSLEKLAIYGRGSVLHAFEGPRWYQFDIRQLA